MNEIRRLELAVIAAAQQWRNDVLARKSNDVRNDNIARLRNVVDALTSGCDECNAGGHICPGDGTSITHGASDCGEHDDDARQEEPIWVARTWVDVRTGDDVHLPGTQSYAHVQHAERQAWHVDPRTGTAKWNPPVPLEWSGVKVTLNPSDPAAGVAEFTMDPAKPIEIKLTPAELATIELLGWQNRIEQRS